MALLSAYRKRRTQYALGNDLPVSREEVETLIKEAIKESPSAFNSQSSRALILFGDESVQFWNGLVADALRPLVPADAFAETEQKLAGFAAGAGTILFYEDQTVIKGLQERFALYADKFPEFSANSAGMAQFAVWTALANKNIGASLQHYNPVIDEAVKAAYPVPASWQLSAQMPFGAHAASIGEKDYIDDTDRFIVVG
ncbi:MAG TPA: nitroreductase family protein [Alcanivoracaceae bacterium]|nr:nitroreductase family protein [Alcanivoracaceae bacterium]